MSGCHSTSALQSWLTAAPSENQIRCNPERLNERATLGSDHMREDPRHFSQNVDYGKNVLVAMLVLACLFGAYFLLHWNAPPETAITGRAWVIDGDTISISGTHIRLEGIDAPERDQTCLDAAGKAWPCGQTATRQLRDQVRGRDLSCAPRTKDRHQRVLAVCSLPDGSDLNAWMVRQGWAVASGFVKIYGDEEAEAEAQKRGMWAGSFDPPWKWREQHKPK
jgi:endonuclease YncB( thermonuclease family)